MRMRTKTWAKPELAACKYYINEPIEKRGTWQSSFDQKKPIHLEFGCGKGVFLADLAYENPDINFVGVDISWDILGVARRNIAKRFDGNLVKNILLTRFNIEQSDTVFSKEDNIERIYICFCNPWPKPRHKKRRLTHTRQLSSYKNFLSENGEIYFKTDDDDLFEESKAYFKECGFSIEYITKDLHNSDFEGNVLTEHEIKFSNEGIPIKFLIAKQNL